MADTDTESTPPSEESPSENAVDLAEPATTGGPAEAPSPELADLQPTADAFSSNNLDLILNVKVNLSMEVGSTQIPIRRLLQLTQGSVVELDQMAGQPMNVLVNGTLIAQGEVVLVNDRIGIRLTDVISPSERVKSIN